MRVAIAAADCTMVALSNALPMLTARSVEIDSDRRLPLEDMDRLLLQTGRRDQRYSLFENAKEGVQGLVSDGELPLAPERIQYRRQEPDARRRS